MAKELPYFEFEPAEYLAGDISFCSLESQGLFVLICCYYWQRSCSLTKEQFLKRMNKPKEFEELIKEKIIKVDNRGFISINFLNDKFEKATEKSKINSINGAKGGRPKKQSKSENKPTALNSLSETKGIREYNIIKEEIKENIYIEFLEKNYPSKLEAMKSKIPISDRKQFFEFFNNKCILEDVPMDFNKINARFNILQSNWNKDKPKEYIKPLKYLNPND